MFDIIIANHLLEHLTDFENSLKEIFRILKDDGLLVIRLPYFRHHSAVGDLTYKRFFNLNSFDHFDRQTLAGKRFGHETTQSLTIENCETTFFPLFLRRNKFIHLILRPFHSIMTMLSRNVPFFLEELIFPFVFPREVLFILSKGKPNKQKLKLAKWIQDHYDFMQPY